MKPWLLLCLVGTLAGCVHFEPQTLSPTQTARSLESRTLTNASLRAFIERNSAAATNLWPRPSWDLPSLTLAALFYHPGLEVARTQWSVTQAEALTAGARPNPTVSISPEYSLNPASGISPWTAGLSFDIPIETAGKRGYRIARARHLSEAARFHLGTVAWQVRSRLRTSLISFAAAHRRLELLSRHQAGQEQIVTVLKQRLQAGAIAPSELASARIALAKTQAEYRNAQSQVAEARTSVAEAIGIPSDALAGVTLQYDLEHVDTREVPLPEARSQALHHRPDILAALSKYAATQSALQLEIARQYPDLHLGPGYQFDQGENKWALGLSVELPILDQNRGPIAEARARRAESAAHFVALQAQILSEVDRAVAERSVALEQLRAADALLPAQQEQLASTQAQARVGAIDPLELQFAQLDFATAQLARLETAVKAHQALAALEDAVRAPSQATEWSLLEQPQPPSLWSPENRETKP